MNRRFVIQVQKDKLAYGFSISLLVLYAFTTGLASKIYRSGALLYGTFLISIIALFAVSNRKRMKFSVNESCVILMILFMVFNNNANLRNGAYEQLIFSVTFYLAYINLNRSGEWIEFLFSLVCPIGIFYGIATYFFRINSGAYYSIVIPLFSNYTSEYQQNYAYLNGFMNGFTPNGALNAFYIICAIGILITKIMAGQNKHKSGNIICIVVLCGAVLMTGKRAHFMFALLSIIVVYFCSYKRNALKKYLKFFIVFFAGFITFMVASKYVPSLLSVFNKFRMQSNVGRMDSGRFIMWRQAFTFFKSNLFFGIGWDGFKYSYGSLSGSILNVHNVYIQILTEMGIFGAIPFFVFFVNSFSHSFKALKYVCDIEQIDFKKKAMVMYALFIQLFFLLYCLTGNPLYDATTLLMYLLSCAIGEYFFYYSEEGFVENK